MDQKRFGTLLRTIVLLCFITRNVFSIQKREWIDTPAATVTEGDVACFSEYMEMWIHSARSEGLAVWLSGALRIQVNLASLDHLNVQLSSCGFSLHNDPDKNVIFRVSYAGCFVQQQNGFNVLVLNLMKRISRFGGRPHSFIMKCPAVSLLPNREQIQCDPEFIQVTRQVPRDNWNNELPWSLSLSDHVIVALEDASLIQMNTDISGPDITVQGRRKEVLSPVKVMGKEGEFLALKLVSGQYAYSMEATCPEVTSSAEEDAVLHIFKRDMGLTKRGSLAGDTLTVSEVLVNQTENFTVHETNEFVTLMVPTAQILQSKACADSKQLLQLFYRVDVVLTFKETNHKMHWTMENTLPCTANTTASSTLKHESLAAEQPPLDRSTAPAWKPNERATLEFSTTESPHMQTDNGDASQRGNTTAGFEGDIFTSFNASETRFLDFANATMNTSADPVHFESSVTAEPSTHPPEPETFHTASGNKEQRTLKWLWEA